MNKLQVRNGVSGEESVIDAAAEELVVDVSDLDNITCHVVQAVDAGTVTLALEHSFDGTYWAPLASIADTDFTAGAGAVEEHSLSDANGMPIVTGQVRLRASALAAGGSYALVVAGRQRGGFA